MKSVKNCASGFREAAFKDFKDFIHVYSQMARADNLQKFDNS